MRLVKTHSKIYVISAQCIFLSCHINMSKLSAKCFVEATASIIFLVHCFIMCMKLTVEQFIMTLNIAILLSVNLLYKKN